MTLSRYEYQLNGGTPVSLLLANSGDITDAGFVVGSNTIRFRGYDAVAGVAGRWSSTVTFERAAEAGGFSLGIGGGGSLGTGGGNSLGTGN